MRMILAGAAVLMAGLGLWAFPVHGAEGDAVVYHGRIIMIVKETQEDRTGSGFLQTIQTLEVQISQGPLDGQNVQVENDVSPLKAGDQVNLVFSTDEAGQPLIHSVGFVGVYRLPTLGWLAVLFVFLVVIFGGWQGIRGLASLAGSLALIVFALLPGLLHGLSPIGLSIGVSALIIILGSYITHGFNRTTTAAVLGMIVTVALVGTFALYAVHAARLSGMESEETIYLQLSNNLNLVGLLLGGILIGLLGILYDIAIGQAIAVEELRRASPEMPAGQLYRRAARIGREHIGALVNTLAIAYVGASLPLLLLFYSGQSTAAQTLNNEIFSTEIVRTLVGSIGLVIAAPIATAVAVAMLKNTLFITGAGAHGHHH
ncbi:MAG TPA: YibE/F family protein [Candidatus Paceibacterota bacterium]|nr:YibE/F family protein [Candidatus Paceibacterota bacterium]